MSIYPQVQFMLSVAAPAQFPPDHGWEMAMAGRSNAGKSTAINTILARHNLARVSKTPGRTQLLNYFELAPNRRLVDLPGYGHAKVPNDVRAKWGPLVKGLQARESFQALMLVVDSRRGVKPEDLGLLDWADRPGNCVHVLLSKADQLTQSARMAALREAQAQLGERAGVSLFSALKGIGLEDARRVVLTWASQGE
ncbi:MAG: ribosome biogenesis GTP-binding protein YihA/YsxC [Steroidobacteraceae bacterium]